MRYTKIETYDAHSTIYVYPVAESTKYAFSYEKEEKGARFIKEIDDGIRYYRLNYTDRTLRSGPANRVKKIFFIPEPHPMFALWPLWYQTVEYFSAPHKIDMALTAVYNELDDLTR